MMKKKQALYVALGIMMLLAAGGYVFFLAEPKNPNSGSRADMTALRDGELIEFSELPPIEYREAQVVHRDSLDLLRLYGDTATFGRIHAIFDMSDPYLMVIDALSSPHVAVLNEETGAVASWIGRDGQGPREFRNPDVFYPADDDPNAAWVHDFANRRLSLVRVDDEGQAEIAEEFEIRINQDIEYPAWTRGGRIVATAIGNNATLLFMNRHGEVLSQISLMEPFSEEDMPHATGRYMLNRAVMAVRPNGDNMVVGYYSAIDFVILDPDGTPVTRFRGPKVIEARFHLADGRFFWDDGSQFAYARLLATDSHILAYYCGCAFWLPTSAGESPSSAARPELHVFTWDGEFVGEYYLPADVLGSTLAVGSDGRTLFGGIEDPYPRVAEWELPSELWPAGDAGD